MIKIDEELPVTPYSDEGPWRSYHVQTEGETLGELFDAAWVYEVDQDGGDLGYYKLNDCETEEVFVAAWRIIMGTFKKNTKV